MLKKGFKFSKKSKRKMSESHIGLNSGKKHWNWKGGIIKDGRGYMRVWHPEHPRTDKKGYVRRSYLEAEKILERYLTPEEMPHHINGNRSDDRPENLLVVTKQAHTVIHGKTRSKLNIKSSIESSAQEPSEAEMDEFVRQQVGEVVKLIKFIAINFTTISSKEGKEKVIEFIHKFAKEYDQLRKRRG